VTLLLLDELAVRHLLDTHHPANRLLEKVFGFPPIEAITELVQVAL
jgi:hypothetical protein